MYDNVNLDDTIVEALKDLQSEVEVLQYSGKGANGHLFFADHKILNRRIAIKFYYWDEERAHDEPRRLSEIESQHVLPVFSARVLSKEWAMFQTPYCPKGDLDHLMSRGYLSLYSAIDHTVGVLTGVSSLHAKRLVHRDLKPGNIFLNEEDSAVIGDFGSVKAVPDDDDEVIGSGHTVLYRPPESFTRGGYSFAGDRYQCGLVLYQLLGGVLPYDARAWLDREGKRCWERASNEYEKSKCVDAAIERRALRGRLLDMGSLPGTVPPILKRVVRKATRADPAHRYAGCAEFIGALRRVREHCLDWQWNGEEAVLDLGAGQVRVCPADKRYIAQLNRGSGWRKVKGIPQGDLEDLVRQVEERYG